MPKSAILQLYSQNQTVFSTKDIALIWEEQDRDLVKQRIHRYLKSGKLYPIKKGLYTKDKNYNKLELAVKVYTPSYISFETVTIKAGMTFQHYDRIFVASYLSREIEVDGQVYEYRKIKKPVLTNIAGIDKKENYAIATPERAFLDLIYLSKDYYFDNLSPINWSRVNKILPIYSNKRMKKTVEKHKKSLEEEK
ncbi:MAG: type IV toxin-antitoxin system AbiEi family antitoxin domain-containing protein [Elusimicrobiota bacterium]